MGKYFLVVDASYTRSERIARNMTIEGRCVSLKVSFKRSAPLNRRQLLSCRLHLRRSFIEGIYSLGTP